MPYVYILGTKQNKYYIGSTNDLESRLKHHFGKNTPSTKRLDAEKLLFSQYYETLSEARKIENRLKKLKRRDYIEKIIEDGEIKMQ